MTTKIAVCLTDDLVAAARQAVHDGRAASVSTFVAQAIDQPHSIETKIRGAEHPI